jgi:hypothetical protein
MDIGFRVTSIRVGRIFPNPRKNRRKHGSKVPKLVNTSSSQLDKQENPASQNKANKRQHHPSQQSHQSVSRTTCRNSVPSVLIPSASHLPSLPSQIRKKERKNTTHHPARPQPNPVPTERVGIKIIAKSIRRLATAVSLIKAAGFCPGRTAVAFI